jgi:DNA-binding response OmpR family regulator
MTNLPATILVADDDELLRLLAERLLISEGYHVILAADGEELVRLALAAPPDLVITDLELPVLDGLAAIRRLRAEVRIATVPILALNANADYASRALAAGADNFLAKPYRLDDLLARVAVHLRCRDQGSGIGDQAAARGLHARDTRPGCLELPL